MQVMHGPADQGAEGGGRVGGALAAAEGAAALPVRGACRESRADMG